MTTRQETLKQAIERASLSQKQLDILNPPTLLDLLRRGEFFSAYVALSTVVGDNNTGLWITDTDKLHEHPSPNEDRVLVLFKEGVLYLHVELKLIPKITHTNTLREFQGRWYVKNYYEVVPVNRIEIVKG